MAESGAATTLMINSYGNDVMADLKNTTIPKYLTDYLHDLVYGTVGSEQISPAWVLMDKNSSDDITTVGQKLVWSFKNKLPKTQFRNPRTEFIPQRFDGYTQQAEVPVSISMTDLMIDRFEFDTLNAGNERMVNLYKEFIATGWQSMQENLVLGLLGDGVQGYSNREGLHNLNVDASAIPMYGFGFPVESASRTNAILSTGNTIYGLDRTVAANAVHQAKLWDAQSTAAATTAGGGFPAGSSPGTFAAVNAMTIPHLLYVIEKSRIGIRKTKHVFFGQEEFVQLTNLAEIKTIMSAPNGQNPELAKFGFSNFMINDVTFTYDPLFSRPGQVLFTNLDTTKVHFSRRPQLSPIQWMRNTGLDQYYQNINCVCQVISYLPGLNAVLYNYGL